MNSKTKQCPICKLEDQKIINTHDYGDETTFDCARCGRFTITRSAEYQVQNTEKPAELSGWLRERNLLAIEVPVLTTKFLDEVIKTLPNYSPLEKQNKLLKAIETLTTYPGKEVALIPEHEVSLAWAQNQQEFEFYIKSLIDRGLIEVKNPEQLTISDPEYPMVITAAGWEYLEQYRSDITSKAQGFVAMSFDKSLLPVYENAIAPAIESTGYRPYRIDSQPHLERIDAKIIAEIKNSRFVVADVTQQKAGVYYEAGFAHGLGIPVIWCVREDDLKNVHFDTRQYNHILWDTEDNLQDQLKNVILATIGKK